jgi:hypothetical protein
VEERLPLMICEPGYLRVSSLASGIDLLTPTTDDDLFTLIAVQNEAYGDMLPRPEVVKRQRAFLRAGGIALLVRDQVTGETVGGGICDVPFDRTTELSSVGVRPPWLAADRRSARYSFPEYHDGKDRLRAISRERGSIKKYRVQPGEKQRKP